VAGASNNREATSPRPSQRPFRRRLLHHLRFARYRVALAYYKAWGAVGGPDYVDEITYWDGILRQRASSLFDRGVREAAFPHDLRECLPELRRHFQRTPRLLEVGSGPVSILAAGADDHSVEIVAIDPLARIYGGLLGLYDVQYPIRPLPGRGESLATRFPADSFEIVYSSNALDHARSPLRCLEQMCRVLRPRGVMVLEGFVREGSHGHWIGLHQHDLFPENGDLVHVDPTGRRTTLTRGLPLTCVSARVRLFRDRGIHSFGYEVPPSMPSDAPDNWQLRDWYTLLFHRM
jgi:SAM-dependent methyltransferase